MTRLPMAFAFVHDFHPPPVDACRHFLADARVHCDAVLNGPNEIEPWIVPRPDRVATLPSRESSSWKLPPLVDDVLFRFSITNRKLV